jgi:hypothetical protein
VECQRLLKPVPIGAGARIPLAIAAMNHGRRPSCDERFDGEHDRTVDR